MSEDDYSIEDITPEDLGCMGEKEVDDGVKEAAIASGSEQKVPVPKSFAHVPFNVKKRARKLYDSFEKKDMPFEDFCTELYALESPALMRADLQGMADERHGRNQRMAANLHNVGRGLN